jgi:hypothetical protein
LDEAASGFSWLAVAGKKLTGWLVIDMCATLINRQLRRGSRLNLEEGQWIHLLGV